MRPSSESYSPAVRPEDALAELERILRANSFRSSKRSQQFLRHVVHYALAGDLEQLKERSIGVAVFERPPGYDTSEDAAVRVAAGEVRKRLAQFYQDSPPGRVRIDLPPGSYIPEFQALAPEPAVEDHVPAAGRGALARSPHWTRRWVAWAGVVGIAVLAGLVWQFQTTPRTAFDHFWRPLLEADRPPVVCLAHPVVYLLSEEVHAADAARRGVSQLAGPYVVDVEPGQLRRGDLVPATDQYVGSGDAYASSQIMSLFAQHRKPAQLRIGNDISFSDLRAAPAVLIGAYSNRWTMKANTSNRFAFEHHAVVDRGTPGRVWRLKDMTPDYKSSEDYAVVSRIFQSYTGQVVITAAGITNAGTHAAAEFLSSPESLNAAMASAPAGWQSRNVELVLHCKVIGNTPGPPEVVASHYW